LSDAELLIVPVGPDGAAGAPTAIALDGFDVLDGFDAHPCGIWAPDGRWVAFGGRGEVWVVDTQTGAIRRLSDLRPSDLEWRPGTDQLAIAGDVGPNRSAPTVSTPITIYSVSTGELRQLGSAEAAQLTWSPDGSTLAYTGGEEQSPAGLWFIDADGANQRLFVADPGQGAVHGIGPVWSPAGDRIAYLRGIGCCEESEVVLVSVTDGYQTVIEPPETDEPNGQLSWYPFSVTWSPDGTTLLYRAWSVDRSGTAGPEGVLAVSVDSPSDVTVLSDEIHQVNGSNENQWVPVQWWGQQAW
jgi:Tol biopolymer transport system component